MENIDGSRNSLWREVRIGSADDNGSVVSAGIDFGGQVVARTKRIFLANTKAQSHFFCG